MRKLLPHIKKVLFYTVLVVVCFEIALWILGFRPYENVDYKVVSEPKNAFMGDPDLGIRLNPGSYTITLNDSVEFKTTHLDNGQRKVPNLNEISDSSAGEIHFFGCSFTYGYGVNDEETFAAITQKEWPNYRVYNHAVSGYGTVHSLLQLQEEDNLMQDDVVLLCFSTYHFMRNPLSQEYRSRLKIGFENSSKNLDKKMENARFPSKQGCNEEINYFSWEEMYENWAGRELFATINFLQTQWDYYLDSDLDQVAIAECLIQEMYDNCAARKVKFGVVCLDQDKRTQKLQKALPDIPWVSVQFDFGNSDLTNLPFDSHPNAKGHQFIHYKLSPFLGELLSK